MLDIRSSWVCAVSILVATASLLLPEVVYARDAADHLQEVNASVFTKLRTDYSKQVAYDPFYFADKRRQALTDAIKAKDTEQVVALGESWLEHCPVDAEVHFHVAMALTAMGRHREAFSHLYSFHGLIQSILESGTGSSKESAFRVISISEEYAVLRVLRAERGTQSLDEPYDVMKVKIADHETTLYFDVSPSLEAQKRQSGSAMEGATR